MTTKEHKNQNQSLPQNFYRVGEVNQIIIFALKLPRRMAVTRPPANTQPHPQPQPKPKPQFQQSPSQTNLAQTSTMPYTNGSPSRQNPIYQRAPSLQSTSFTLHIFSNSLRLIRCADFYLFFPPHLCFVSKVYRA